jgi:hypothetical protein
MKIHFGGRLFLVAAVVGVAAVFAIALLVALGGRSVVAEPGSAPPASPPNPGHSWNEIGDLPGTMWHSNNDGPGSGLDADTLDGLQSTQIQDADDYVSNAGHATTADSATSATSADHATTAGDADTVDALHANQIQDADDYVSNAGHANTADSAASATSASYAATAGDADTVDALHANQIQDADDYVSSAGYCTAAGNADTLDGQDGAYYRDATNINAGTLDPGYYSAYSDLGAEGYLGNEAGDLAQNNGLLQATLNADLLDGVHANQIQDADDYVSSAGYCTAAGNADTLDGQHGAYYRNASNINGGTLDPAYYSAYGDLSAEGYLGNEAGDLARNNSTLQATLNADLLDGQHANQIQDADDYVSTAGYCAAAGNADTVDGQHASAFAAASHTHDDRYYTETELQTSGSASVHWGNLSSVPAGFADDVDNDVLGGLSCANGEIAKWDGSAWQCAADDTGTGSFWSLTGNSGTSGSNFLGTTDNQALELRVNNTRALRLEPGALYPNVIGGFASNSVSPGVDGASIGGGGSPAYPNRVTDMFGTVGGGIDNRAGNANGDLYDSQGATVGGGHQNTASGLYATVGGGVYNLASASVATVGGGYGNVASAATGTVAGGLMNTASGNQATASGGHNNTASNSGATVGGGGGNTAGGEVATVGGGSSNTASGFAATVGGGQFNAGNGMYSTVPGGGNNTAQGNYSLAAGRRAKANHQGAFVWADSTDADFASTANDQFLVRASGGVGLNVTSGALRLEPNATSANVIAGYSGNNVTAAVVGAAICGGGSSGNTNRVTDDYGTVGGGQNNQAGNNAGTTADRPYATVGGGAGNLAASDYATVGGGASNAARWSYTTVGGGQSNLANADHATVGGGQGNTASGYSSTVAGGSTNWAGSSAATVGGGANNTATGYQATVAGGASNTASVNQATVGGGQSNTAANWGSTIGGGYFNGASGGVATVAGGQTNSASGGFATVGGGQSNVAGGQYATVGGGRYSTAGGDHAFVGGGDYNAATGRYATVPGGYWSAAGGDYSFAAGRFAKANHQGAFVWGDSTDAIVDSVRNDQFRARANGGARFDVNNGGWVEIFDQAAHATTVLIDTSTGAYLTTAGTWTNASSRDQKENFTPVDGQEVLATLAEMPITTWNSKAEDPSIRHMGPVAQDFYAAFGLGASDTSIGTLDADGVALAAIQGLYQLSQEQAAQIAAQQERIKALEQAQGANGGSAGPLSSGLTPAWLLLGGLVVVGLVLVQRRRAGGSR